MCETLGTAIQGGDADDLNESAGMALKGLERCVDQPQPCPLTISSIEL